MDNNNSNKSVTQKRRIPYYPRPHYEILVKSYALNHGMSRSSVVELGVKLFFDTLPSHERELLLKSEKKISK
jgi:hypothetical protein